MYKLNRLDPELFYEDRHDVWLPLPLNKACALHKLATTFYSEGRTLIGRIGGVKSVTDTEEVYNLKDFMPIAEKFLDSFCNTAAKLIDSTTLLYMTIFQNKAFHFIGEGMAYGESTVNDDDFIDDPAFTQTGIPPVDVLRTLEYALLSRDGWIDSRRLRAVEKDFPGFNVIQLTNATDPQGLEGQNRICMVVFVWGGIKFRYDRGLNSSSLKATLSRV